MTGAMRSPAVDAIEAEIRLAVQAVNQLRGPRDSAEHRLRNAERDLREAEARLARLRTIRAELVGDAEPMPTATGKEIVARSARAIG